MAAVLLNIKISLTNPSFMEQGNTLSTTLLPFIELCSDFNFLQPIHNCVLDSFLEALSQHVRDTMSTVGQGFMIFALKFNPRQLASIVVWESNQIVLKQTLQHLGFTESSSSLMQAHPSKFLWPELLKFFKDKPQNLIDDCVKVLAKLEVLEDPGNKMNTLYDIFGQRRIIVDQLLKVESMSLNISQLIIALELICNMKSETIVEIFKLHSSKWVVAAEQNHSKEDADNSKVVHEKLHELYASFTKATEKPLPLEEMLQLSKEMSQELEVYRHCEYQSMIAAAVISQESNFIIATVPTGSGKTWIQGLVARYFCL